MRVPLTNPPNLESTLSGFRAWNPERAASSAKPKTTSPSSAPRNPNGKRTRSLWLSLAQMFYLLLLLSTIPLPFFMFISVENVGHCVYSCISCWEDMIFSFLLIFIMQQRKTGFWARKIGFLSLALQLIALIGPCIQCDRATMMMMYFLLICSFFSFFLYSITGNYSYWTCKSFVLQWKPLRFWVLVWMRHAPIATLSKSFWLSDWWWGSLNSQSDWLPSIRS